MVPDLCKGRYGPPLNLFDLDGFRPYAEGRLPRGVMASPNSHARCACGLGLPRGYIRADTFFATSQYDVWLHGPPTMVPRVVLATR